MFIFKFFTKVGTILWAVSQSKIIDLHFYLLYTHTHINAYAAHIVFHQTNFNGTSCSVLHDIQRVNFLANNLGESWFH